MLKSAPTLKLVLFVSRSLGPYATLSPGVKFVDSIFSNFLSFIVQT